MIGGGPAGLTAANDLADAGFAVTVYEALPAAGGMLRYGIPEYRLPKKVLDHEIEIIRRKGVRFVYNCRIGKDVTFQSLRNEFDAVFISAGAQKSRKLGVNGEQLAGVVEGVEFLREVASHKKPVVKGTVMVVGGGDTAFDSARTALRLGAEKVIILYRRSRAEMPATPSEIEAAEEEGIDIRYLVAPVRLIEENGKVSAVECIQMKLGEPDASGRRRPVEVEGSEFTLEADMVISAIGQMVDEQLLGHINVKSENGRFTIDPVTGQTFSTRSLCRRRQCLGSGDGH